MGADGKDSPQDSHRQLQKSAIETPFLLLPPLCFIVLVLVQNPRMWSQHLKSSHYGAKGKGTT